MEYFTFCLPILRTTNGFFKKLLVLYYCRERYTIYSLKRYMKGIDDNGSSCDEITGHIFKDTSSVIGNKVLE